MKRRRVKITGIGPVTPAGVGRESFWKGIQEPVSRVRPYHGLGEEFGPFVATYLDDFDLRQYLKAPGPLLGAARHTQFALAGSVLALNDAGISQGQLQATRSAVIVGASIMDFGGICRTFDSVAKRGARGAQARVVYTANLASIGGAMIQAHRMEAQSMTLQSSCCAGLDALGFGARLIAEGQVDLAICGGTEAPLHRHPMLELRGAGLTPSTLDQAERQCRPFDLWRTTGVVGEGACMFVLESEASPRSAYGWIRGYGFASDETEEVCGGLAVAVRLALAEARIRPAEVQSLNAWGPGHREIDAAEVLALERVFGEELQHIPATSIKGSIGSPLGAAPAIQAGAAMLAQWHGVLPPTVNWQYPDPACRLHLSNQPRPMSHETTLISAHGLAGVNTAMVISR